jgi:hypothetical protein
MANPERPVPTHADLLALPGEQRAEILAGAIQTAPAPLTWQERPPATE